MLDLLIPRERKTGRIIEQWLSRAGLMIDAVKLEYLADHKWAVPIVAGWFFEQWGHKTAENSYTGTHERLVADLESPGLPIYIVALDGETPLGAARIKRHEMNIYPDFEHWLGNVFVAPEARGHGIAAKLTENIVEIAKSLGVQEVYLQTERLDGGLYAKLGWQPIEQAHYKGTDVLVMKRKLS